jgi:hypothetical protein
MKLIKAELLSEVSQSIGFHTWLPFAAIEYNISPNVDDYIFYSVPLHTSDIPNRNGVAMPLAELLKWNTTHGCQSYATWKGKPMFQEHRSEDVKKACGIIADVSLRPIKGYGKDVFWKVMVLAALDTKKYPDVINRMKSGELNTYSMGAMIEGWNCSYCGAPENGCNHIDPKKPVDFYALNGRLVYKKVHGIVGYEFSVVADPACPASVSDVQIKMRT